MLEYQGARLIVRYCEQPPVGADLAVWQPPSWQETLAHIPVPKRAGIWAKMVARRKLLADEGQLRSPDYWNTEAELPDGKRFYAIKVDRVRAYGWFSVRHKGVFYISHFAFEKGQKLAKADEQRVAAQWRQIEEQRR
jgi:hypothetical protein